MRTTGLKIEKRITPEGIELKFNYKLEENIFTSINFDDVFKREQEVSGAKILKLLSCLSLISIIIFFGFALIFLVQLYIKVIIWGLRGRF